MHPDPWLQRWLPLLLDKSVAGSVLEIGCGPGEDTAVLCGAGLKVRAFDLSPQAVAAAQQRVPSALITCQDVREPWPAGPYGAIVASLSLHYFPWGETQRLFSRVHEALLPGGVLLCRLNSTQDHHYGASGHPQIEPNFYQVDGAPKRFFDQAAIDALFQRGWKKLSCEHGLTGKYEHPKALWEIVLERTER
jgi:SAM-dependent methyltransferase